MIFELLDVDKEPIGLIKVEVPLTGAYSEREKLLENLVRNVINISQTRYSEEFIGVDELIETICGDLNDLGYDAHSYRVQQINLV